MNTVTSVAIMKGWCLMVLKVCLYTTATMIGGLCAVFGIGLILAGPAQASGSPLSGVVSTVTGIVTQATGGTPVHSAVRAVTVTVAPAVRSITRQITPAVGTLGAVAGNAATAVGNAATAAGNTATAVGNAATRLGGSSPPRPDGPPPPPPPLPGLSVAPAVPRPGAPVREASHAVATRITGAALAHVRTFAPVRRLPPIPAPPRTPGLLPSGTGVPAPGDGGPGSWPGSTVPVTGEAAGPAAAGSAIVVGGVATLMAGDLSPPAAAHPSTTTRVPSASGIPSPHEVPG